MNKYILAIDQGTTSTRVVLYDFTDKQNITIISSAQRELGQIYPLSNSNIPNHSNNALVEHNPEVILNDVIDLIKITLDDAKNTVNIKNICGLGITNQRETTVVWDKTTGKPVHNAIVWQDRRTAEYCAKLDKNSPDISSKIHSKTGLLLDPYFSATKIKWLYEQYNLHNNKNLLFGTIDSYLIWHLTSDVNNHFTDATNASRTMLYNINTLDWDHELLDIFNIPSYILPKVKNTCDNFGIINKKLININFDIPILAVAGDQQAASIGQYCYKEKSCKITFGTGCFILENTADKIIKSKHRLLSTIAYVINNKPSYAIEGSIFVAGAAIQWLRDAIKLISHASDSEHIAKNLEHNNGVYLVPAFTGLGAPHWDAMARGAILGLTRDTGLEHIVRAALESVAYQAQDLLLALKQDYSLPAVIKVDGGMAANNWFLQFLADLTQTQIDKPANNEATVYGIGLLAALQAGIYNSLEDIEKLTSKPDQTTIYKPKLDSKHGSDLYNGWLDAIDRIKTK